MAGEDPSQALTLACGREEAGNFDNLSGAGDGARLVWDGRVASAHA